MKLLIIVIAQIVICSLCYGQKTIKVYHGQDGRTGVIQPENGLLRPERKMTIVAAEGDSVEIEIVNAHEGLYKYAFSTKSFEIDYGVPDLSEIVGALGKMVVPINEESKAIADSIKKGAKGLLEVKKSEIDKLRDALRDILRDLQTINSIIKLTDVTETIEEARQLSNTSMNGLRSQITQLKNDPLLTSYEARRTELLELLDAAYPQGTPENPIYLLYIETIFAKIKTLADIYLNLKPPYTVIKKIIVDERPQKVTLEVASLSDNIKGRDTGNVIIISIVPFKKSSVELVPVLSMISSANVSSFNVKNGVITESEEGGVSFKPSILLSLNMLYFGEYKEFSVGPALGYSIDTDTQVFQNFNIGVLFSFKRDIRFGFGWGMQQYRSALTDNSLLGNPLPQDMTINDVTKQVGKSSFMINISLVGLSLSGK